MRTRWFPVLAFSAALAATAVAQPASTNLGPLPMGTTVHVPGIAIAAQQVVWFRFDVPAVGCPVYLDIDTEGSLLAPSNDTSSASTPASALSLPATTTMAAASSAS